MKIKDILLAPRYGIYLPESKTTTDFEFTDYGHKGFKISTSRELGGEDTFEKVKETLDTYLEKAKDYLAGNDLDLLATLLGITAKGASYVIDFGKDGITLASVLTVNARKITFIYDKYSSTEYALQLALTKESSFKFAWSDSLLKGDFYFNLKRTEKEDVTSITGYTFFHLGNAEKATPVTFSAGVIHRIPVEANWDSKVKPEKVKHTYIQIHSRKHEGITIKELLSLVTPDAISIPDALDKFAIHDVAILHRGDKQNSSLAFVLDCTITINDNPVHTKLTIISSKVGDKSQFSFVGLVHFGTHKFRVKFVNENAAWALIAEYAGGSSTINFKHIAEKLFGKEEAGSLPELKLEISKLNAFFYYKKGKDTSKILLGLGAGIDIKLDKLPMAGLALVEAKAIDFKEVLAIYGQGDISNDDLIEIKGLPKNFSYSQGLTINAEVVIDGKTEYFSLGRSNDKNKQTSKEKTKALKAEVSTDEDINSVQTPVLQKGIDAGSKSKASWSKVDKKIGPVHLQRIGFAYENGKVIALIDADISAKGLSMQLLGLGVGFKLDWSNPEPDFYLDGLGLSYTSDAVEVSGALMRGMSDGVETYSGQARIKVKNFTISAIGSYAQVNGESSLFIYGLFEGNIGGPPIFYVTGIAAGFGYNRRINAPEIDEVAEFPLVALAMNPANKSLTEVLTSLETRMKSGKKPIEIAVGNSWLAVGVKFTSFKIIESFALLTVNFGTKTEFNVLGLSRLSWPEQSVRTKLGLNEPIVFVEIALKASFGADSDVIQIDGLITPNSYILSRDCKLSGGFAFYTWVSGKHAGDFVLTIGGYHPRFPKPVHYPIVPRVALNWRISDNLLVKGELYFAFTPSAIMLGGRWEMYYTSSVVKAAFLLWIDILMQWAPFYYDLEIGVMLSIEAHISLKFYTVHLNLELRAQLQIWGPPFSGKATIDLNIYSFEIQFGSKELPNRNSLDWNTFAKGFLPQDDKPVLEQAIWNEDDLELAETKVGEAVDCITTKVTNGIIQTIEEESKSPFVVVNPMQLELIIDSAIPVSQLGVNDLQKLHLLEDSINNQLGVRPCGYEGKDVTFDMQVQILLGGTQVKNFVSEPQTKGFPEALWGSGKSPESKDPNEPKVIGNVMSGIRLKAAEPIQGYLKAFNFSKFVEPANTKSQYQISIPANGEKQAFNTYEVFEKMKQNGKTASRRDMLIKDIQNWAPNEDLQLSDLNEVYAQPAHYFRSSPKMKQIGHKVYHPTDTK